MRTRIEFLIAIAIIAGAILFAGFFVDRPFFGSISQITTSNTIDELYDKVNEIIGNTVSTSSAPTAGQVPYWTGVNTLGSRATTSVTCTGSASCTSFDVFGASPITISSSGDFAWTTDSFGATTVNATSTALQLKGGLYASSTVRFGNAGISPFFYDGSVGRVGIGTTSPYANLSVVGEAVALYFTATSTTVASTFPYASTTALTASSFFQLPNGTSQSPTLEGACGYDTTSGQLKCGDGTNTDVIGNGSLYPSFRYATSTAWTGTTTIALGTAYVAETWNGWQCFTDAGELDAVFTDGANRMDLIKASTTVGTNTLSTNNTFTVGEKRYVEIGNPATSPTEISCTVSKSITAD